MNTESHRMRPPRLQRTARRHRFACSDHSDVDEHEVFEALERRVTCRGACVHFCAEVSTESVLVLVERLEEAARNALAASTPASPPRVLLYIHSDGGDVYAGFSAMAHVRACRVPVATVADGFVASAATLIFLSADERYVVPHSHMLIHQLSTGFWGKYDELVDEVVNSKMVMASMQQIYRERTALGKKKISALLKKELNLSATQCVRYGLARALL